MLLYIDWKKETSINRIKNFISNYQMKLTIEMFCSIPVPMFCIRYWYGHVRSLILSHKMDHFYRSDRLRSDSLLFVLKPEERKELRNRN